LNSHGKLHRVGDDSSKTFYLVMATWFDDSDTKAGEISDGEESINNDEDNDYESGYASDIGVFAHAEKFRDKRVEEHKSQRTVPGPLKNDDKGREESGKEDKVVKKGAVGKGKDDSDGKQKKAKEKKGGGISTSVKSPTKEVKRKGKSSVDEFSPSRNTRQRKGR
jgi:hypothetical protein